MFVVAVAEAADPSVDVAEQLAVPGQDFGGVDDGAGTVGEGVVFGVVVDARSPGLQVGLQGVPVGVAAGGVGLSYTSVAVTYADGVVGADGVGELGEASVFLVTMKF